MLLLTAMGEYGNFQAYVCRVVKSPLPKNKKELQPNCPLGGLKLMCCGINKGIGLSTVLEPYINWIGVYHDIMVNFKLIKFVYEEDAECVFTPTPCHL